MGVIRRLLLLGAGAAAGKVLLDRRRDSQRARTSVGSGQVVDTPTGTDPNAKYSAAGFEDKSLGQAVNQDAELADRLVAESGGNEEQAERRFRDESAGAPKLRTQEHDNNEG